MFLTMRIQQLASSLRVNVLLRKCRLSLLQPRSRHSLAHHLLPPHTLPKHHLPTPHSFTHCHGYAQSPGKESNLCWKCHKDLDEVSRREEGETDNGAEWGSVVRFFCPCDKHTILPPSKRHTYFEIMNCPATYRVDIDALKETFRQLQRQLHPDKFSNSCPEEQDYSAQQSALVNRAYSTLLKPYIRGLYLLELNGLTIDEKDTLMDAPEFLEGMWALRESIEGASASGDTIALQQLQTTNTVNLDKVSDEVGACFESADYAAAKEGLARMKYFVNIEELLKDTLDLPL